MAQRVSSGAQHGYAIGISTNEGIRLQGFHAKKVLFVIDEAPGVLIDIYEAMEGIRAGGDFIGCHRQCEPLRCYLDFAPFIVPRFRVRPNGIAHLSSTDK